MVDEADLDLTRGERREDGVVAVVDLRLVGLDGLEPGLRFGLAFEHPEGRDERLERRVRGGPADLALPRRIGVIDDRCRQVGLVQCARVIGDDTGASGDADPHALRRTVARINQVERGSGDRRKATLRGDCTKRAAVLREEDIRRRGVALLEDRRGELCRPGVLDLDVDTRLGPEALDERSDEGLTSSRVDRQRAGQAYRGGWLARGCGGPTGRCAAGRRRAGCPAVAGGHEDCRGQHGGEDRSVRGSHRRRVSRGRARLCALLEAMLPDVGRGSQGDLHCISKAPCQGAQTAVSRAGPRPRSR